MEQRLTAMHRAFSNMLRSIPDSLCILEVLLGIIAYDVHCIGLGCIYGLQHLKPDPELQETHFKLVHTVYPKCAKDCILLPISTDSTPLPGEPHGQRSLVGHSLHRVTKSQTQLK